MDKKRLAMYEEEERQVIRNDRFSAIGDGHISNPEGIFPDIDLPDHRALHRGTSPLSQLCFLYEKTCVYVPPTTAGEIAARLGGLEYEELIELARAGIVQPIIGHPAHYTDKPHLDPILELRPPSIWARGTELLEAMGGDSYFEKARRVIDLEKAARLGWVREKWRRQFPHLEEDKLSARIRDELATNYVNLCAFGLEELVESEVFKTSFLDFQIDRLLFLNELLIYPRLMAGGGTPCFMLGDRPRIAVRRLAPRREDAVLLNEVHLYLLTKLELEFPGKFTVEQLKDFHRDESSKRMWEVVRLLEQKLQDPGAGANTLILNAERARKHIDEAIDELAPKITGFQGTVEREVIPWVIRLGGVTSGLISYLGGTIPGIVQGIAIGGAVGQLAHRAASEVRIERWLAARVTAMRFGRFAANLAWLKSSTNEAVHSEMAFLNSPSS